MKNYKVEYKKSVRWDTYVLTRWKWTARLALLELKFNYMGTGRKYRIRKV